MTAGQRKVPMWSGEAIFLLEILIESYHATMQHMKSEKHSHTI